MEQKEERPDARFWTTYDHLMAEREARALRRKQLNGLMRALLRNAKKRIALELKHAGAQPVTTRRLPASGRGA